MTSRLLNPRRSQVNPSSRYTQSPYVDRRFALHSHRRNQISKMEFLMFKESESVTSFDKRLDPASYTVETIQLEDDAGQIPQWKRRLYRLSPFTTLISRVAYFLYTYRIHCTLDAQLVFNKVYVMAWIFISAEGCVACKYS